MHVLKTIQPEPPSSSLDTRPVEVVTDCQPDCQDMVQVVIPLERLEGSGEAVDLGLDVEVDLLLNIRKDEGFGPVAVFRD